MCVGLVWVTIWPYDGGGGPGQGGCHVRGGEGQMCTLGLCSCQPALS